LKVASTQDESQVGPVLASFPALQPPSSTPFKCYLKRDQVESNQPFSEIDSIIVGETSTMEFVSGGESKGASAGCSYLVGIYSKKTKTTTLTPAPLHLLTHQVKSLKNLQPIASSQPDPSQRNLLRNKLGETFGTKKAKAAIKAFERNKVDLETMKGVTDHLQERVGENTSSLPSRAEVEAMGDANRLIPPFNKQAHTPDEVYALHDLIPLQEFNAIQTSTLKGLTSDKDRFFQLPYSRSDWVQKHMKLLFSTPKVKNSDLKIMFYISTLLSFHFHAKSVKDKKVLQDKMDKVPSVIVDGLLARFTETARDSTEACVTSQYSNLLLTYIFALCLRIDDYATGIEIIASDLRMPIGTVETLFKQLGCKITTLNEIELRRLGRPDSDGKKRHAVLKVPLEFPAPRVKRSKR